MNPFAFSWLDNVANYEGIVTQALGEAPARHSFVTEFAGSTAPMKGALDWKGRFGDLMKLATITDAAAYGDYLRSNGYQFGGLPAVCVSNEPNVATQYARAGRAFFRIG